jgi:hypothetical protein
MKRRILILMAGAVMAVAAVLMTGCSLLTSLRNTQGYGGMADVAAGLGLRGGMVRGQYYVELVRCVGSSSAQEVTAVVAITNQGPGGGLYVGGSSDGTLSVDGFGNTAKPYGSAGTYYEFPSGVTITAEVPRIGPVRPGSAVFQILRISVGSGDGNTIDFRNVPIVWEN